MNRPPSGNTPPTSWDRPPSKRFWVATFAVVAVIATIVVMLWAVHSSDEHIKKGRDAQLKLCSDLHSDPDSIKQCMGGQW